MKNDADYLFKMRHSLSHVLAQAVLELRPSAQLAFGPAIDNGCYYDFFFEKPITPEDFPALEERMRRIIAARQPFVRRFRTTAEAIEHLRKNNQPFKVEYCAELAARGESQISFYSDGPFEDMCEGPHLEHTGQIPAEAFKIDSLAGAYWRGSEKNPQLSRIYCLAFESKEKLEEYIKNREEARERDHRKLGKELELFILSEEIGAGLPLWTPYGTVIREALEALAKETEARYGYQRVATPHITKEELYYKSGHLPYYKESMFPPMKLEGESSYYLKPMNCPHHHMIYSYRPRSYRELPLRLAEYGTCYRFEHSGSLSGLVRVRSLAMNDAHIYCTPGQLKSELVNVFNLHFEYYRLFRLANIKVRFSTHDPKNREKYVDNPELWKFSEEVVAEVLKELKVEHYIGKGEAAFYGPKIDFQATTLVGREESLGTNQLDFYQPVKFNLTYIAEDGHEHQVYVVHRAPLSTHERMVAFLLEHFGGAFPTWMAPIQVKIIPVNEECLPYARELELLLKQHLLRVETDASSNSFNKKIREAVIHKIPNIAIVGKREVSTKTLTLRRYCIEQQVTMSRDAFVERMVRLTSQRLMDNFPDVII